MANEDPIRDAMLAAIPHLRAFAISLTGNVTYADDLVQAALLRGLENLDKFQPGTSMQAWLFTILRNQFYTDIRRRRREVDDPEGALAGKLAVMPEQGARLDLNDMQVALAKLSVEQREALLLVGRACPTRRRRRSAAPISARSRAASTAPAPAWRNSWRWMPRRTSAPTGW
jgi:RNA polymerase sigma-70 factor (ECF subfamily)